MTSDPPTHLVRFKEAMQSVYGPFEVLPPSTIPTWTPPPKSGGHKGRYLWTDAFGVLNFITLYHITFQTKYLIFAKSLVNSVHEILGRTRDGSARLGGATDEEPLKGGLRIGKLEVEGGDGDGMYHHYLTLWMFALNRLSIASGEERWNDLAVQLAKVVHPKFLRRGTGGRQRMVWKISMDMQRVLVPSEGHLDAATGYVVFRLLQKGQEDVLSREVQDYKEMMGREGKLTPSNDALDLGMALWMCHFFVGKEEWATTLGEKCLENSKILLKEDGAIMNRSPQYRLAFREFGTCLGIGCYGGDEYLQSRTAAVVKFWEKVMQEVTADDLRPISLVMYAAALIPGAFKKDFFESVSDGKTVVSQGD